MSKLISPMGLVVLVCFFLPWMTASCGSIPIIQDVSGYDIASGFELEGQGKQSEPALFAIPVGAVLMLVAGLALWGGTNKGASAIALIGSLAVIAVWFLYRMGVEQNVDEASQQGVRIIIEWHEAFWGTIFAGAIGALAALVSFGASNNTGQSPGV